MNGSSVSTPDRFQLKRFFYCLASGALVFCVFILIWQYSVSESAKMKICFDEGRALVWFLKDTEGDLNEAIQRARKNGTELGNWSDGGHFTNSGRTAIAVRDGELAGDTLVIWDDYSLEWAKQRCLESKTKLTR